MQYTLLSLEVGMYLHSFDFIKDTLVQLCSYLSLFYLINIARSIINDYNVLVELVAFIN